MARKPLRPLIRSGGFYPSKKWTPLVYAGGYTTANGGGEPEPPPIEKTVTGNPIHILDALAKPVQALSISLEPIQDLHGYDAPWPAGGGKNRLDVANATHSAYNIGSIPNTLLPNTEYTYSINGTTTQMYRLYLAKSSAPLTAVIPLSLGYRTGGEHETFTTPADMSEYDALCLAGGSSTAGDVPLSDILPQIEIGSSATSYSPYSNICPISGHTDADVIVSPTLNPLDGTTYPFPLGQTVYGCVVDAVNGKGLVTHVKIKFSDVTFYRYTSPTNIPVYYASISGMKAGALKSECRCSMFKPVDWEALTNRTDMTICVHPTLSIAYVADSQYTTAESFNEATADADFFYPLATPITIQLTPTQVELLQGENNLFSDGEMTLVYLADGNASDAEALNILLGGRYVNNHEADEPTDREALDILLGGTR